MIGQHQLSITSDINDCKRTVVVFFCTQWHTHFLFQSIALLSVAVRSCWFAFPPPSPPYAFFWEPWRRLLGCPVRHAHSLPVPCYWSHSLHSTQAGPSCVTSWMLVYSGRQAEAALGATRGKGTLRRAEVGSPGRPTVRLGATETHQTGVLTLRCSFTTKALIPSFSFYIMFSSQSYMKTQHNKP